MEKEVRKFTVKFDFDWTYDNEISKIKSDLEALEKLGATHINIESNISYDVAYTEIEAYCERIETDEEFKDRVDFLKNREEEQRQREIEQFNRLKSKLNL